MINLNPDEKIYLIKRRHLFVLIKALIPVAVFFFLIIIGMIFLLFASSFSWPEILLDFSPEFAEFNPNRILLFAFSLLLLILWLIIFSTVATYYLDCWVVTNQRTIHTELRNLFSRIFSSVLHDRIQDITVDIHGILPTVFRFGDLQIQTAGGFREFVFRQIPDPYKTKEIIFKAKKEALERTQKSVSAPLPLRSE